MIRNFNIELEDEIYQELKELCNSDETAMQKYVVQSLNEKIQKNKHQPSTDNKDSLENYLNKGQSGSRNYGVKGQGW